MSVISLTVMLLSLVSMATGGVLMKPDAAADVLGAIMGGTDLGPDPGAGPGAGAGEGLGAGPGEGPGVGAGEGPGAGPGESPGAGPGVGGGGGPGVEIPAAGDGAAAIFDLSPGAISVDGGNDTNTTAAALGADAASLAVEAPGTADPATAPVDPAIDPAIDSGTGTGIDTGVDQGTAAGEDPGPATGADPGATTGIDPGAATGVDPGTATGVDPGPSTRVDPGPDTRVDPGPVTGIDRRTDPMADRGKATRVDPMTASQVDPAKAPRSDKTSAAREPVIGRDRTDTGAPDLGHMVETPALSALQRILDAQCRKKCKTEFCYLADTTDCRNFITCKRDAFRLYTATLQPCAFGTYWAGQKADAEKKITCDAPERVHCDTGYCHGKAAGEKYDHIDGNCKTHWECLEGGKPVPRCCQEGMVYNDAVNDCVNDTEEGCHDVCQIKMEACRIPGQMTDDFDDKNCRTYWQCEHPVLGRRPNVVCCPEGQGYDIIRGCIDMPSCNETCPQEYEKKECHLKTDPDNKGAYMESIHGTYISRPCPAGTEFNYSKCGCGTPVKTSKDNSCTKELSITFDHSIWHRTGSQSQIKISDIGLSKEGPVWNDKNGKAFTSFRFDGDLYYRTPYFQSQYENLYIKITFMPDDAAATGRNVLLSNCMNIDLGAPSMELSLQNGRLVLDLVTDNISPNASTTQNRPVRASVAYEPGQWNYLTAVYDGREVFMLNESPGQRDFDQKPLSGPISVAAEGLDFGGCYINRNLGEGYRGSLAHLEFSKCVKQEWLDEFNRRTPV